MVLKVTVRFIIILIDTNKVAPYLGIPLQPSEKSILIISDTQPTSKHSAMSGINKGNI